MSRLIWIAIAVLALAASACGTANPDGPNGASSTTLSPASTGSSTTPATVSDAPPDGGGEIHGEGRDSNGYGARLDVFFGSAHHVSELPVAPLTRGLVSCQADDSTGVIPVRAVLTNDSGSFAATMQTIWTYEGFDGIKADLSATGNTACYPAEDATLFGLQSDGEVAAGGSLTNDFYILIPDYYTPANPNGTDSGFHGPVDVQIEVNTDVPTLCYTRTVGLLWGGIPKFEDSNRLGTASCPSE